MSTPDTRGTTEPEPETGARPAPTSARAIGLGALWNMGAYLAPQILTLVVSVIVARKLGPADQGIQSYIMFVAMTVGAVFGLGLPSASEQAISRLMGEGRPAVVRAFGLWSVQASLLPAVLSFLTVLVVGHFQYTTWVWAWVAAAVAGAMVTTHAVVAQGLNGLHEFRIPSGIGVATQIVTSIVCAAALLLGAGLTEFVAIQAAGTVVSAALTVRAFVRHLPAATATPALRTGELSTVRRSALRFAMVSGVVVLLETIVTRRSEFIFLGWFHHDRPMEIAFYSVAFAAATAIAAIPLALVSVAMPVISRMIASGDHARMRTGYSSAQKLLLAVGGPAAGGMLGCGGALVFVAYGPEYAKSAHLVVIATLAPVIAGPIGGLASAVLLGSGVPGAAVRAQAIAAVVTILADIVLILPFAAYGAAVAGGLGILAGTWSLTRQARKQIDAPRVGVDVWWNVFVSAMATALPGSLLTALGAPHLLTLFLGAVLGLVLVGVVWRIIKPLTPDHLSMIGSVLDKLPPAGQRLLESFVHYEGTRRR